MEREAVRIRVEQVVTRTEKAIAVQLEGRDDVTWIPESQIEADYDEGLGTMWVTKWIARKKDIPYE